MSDKFRLHHGLDSTEFESLLQSIRKNKNKKARADNSQIFIHDKRVTNLKKSKQEQIGGAVAMSAKDTLQIWCFSSCSNWSGHNDGWKQFEQIITFSGWSTSKAHESYKISTLEAKVAHYIIRNKFFWANYTFGLNNLM